MSSAESLDSLYFILQRGVSAGIFPIGVMMQEEVNANAVKVEYKDTPLDAHSRLNLNGLVLVVWPAQVPL